MLREKLQSTLHEAKLTGSNVLEQLKFAVDNLRKFESNMRPLQQFAEEASKASSDIDKNLTKVKDYASLAEESQKIAQALKNPINTRKHIKNLKRCYRLNQYYQRHQEIQYSQEFQTLLVIYKQTAAFEEGKSLVSQLMQAEVNEYYQKFGFQEITQNKSQLKLIENMKNLMKTSAQEAIYSMKQIRGHGLYYYYTANRQGDKPFISALYALTQALAIEKQFQQHLFEDPSVSEILSEVSGQVFEEIKQDIAKLQNQGNIQQILDAFSIMIQLQPNVEDAMGNGAKLLYYQKLKEGLQKHIIDYFSKIQQKAHSFQFSLNVDVQPIVIEIIQEYAKLNDYSSVLEFLQLNNVIQVTLRALVEQLKEKSEQVQARVKFDALVNVINSMTYFIKGVEYFRAIVASDFVAQLNQWLETSINRYIQLAWASLDPIFQENVIEFKHPNVLSRWSRNAVKNKFNQFNSLWPKVYAEHRNYAFIDAQVLQYVRALSINHIIPNLKTFVNKYLPLDFTRRKQKYTQYSVEAIHDSLNRMYMLKNE